MRILLALHAAVIVLIFFAEPPKWIALGIALLILASWFSLRRHPVFGYGPRALMRLIAHADGSWTLEYPNGMRRTAERAPGGPVDTKLTVIRFKLAGGGACTRALLGDEAAPEPLRRLRARLLLGEARMPSSDQAVS